MNRYRAALMFTLGAALIGLGGCASHQRSTSMLSGADRNFLENAAQGNYAEVRASELAQEKATSSEVREYAAAMIRDHGAANKQLTSLAERKGYALPTEPSIMQKAEIATLSALSGNAFNKMYVDRIGVAAHEATIAQFETAAANSQDKDVRAFAQKMLPALRQHLQMAQALNEKQKSQ